MSDGSHGTDDTDGTAAEGLIRAAGCVLWRPGDDFATGGEPQVALVHRPRYDDWSFPKGKLDTGETMSAAAVREVEEETGHRVRLGSALGDVRYEVADGRKIVRYWAGEAVGGAFEPNDETDELRWVPASSAARLLSYTFDIDVLRRFTTIGAPTSTVLLVRHAKAGSRNQWDGDDDLRPLSGSGREQAARLGRVLPRFGPDRLASAPPVRCRETIAPLAAALGGMPVADEPLLGEEGYWDHPAAGRARLAEITAEPGVTIVCSQGGVIPDVVAALADSSPRPLRIDTTDVPSKKGSIWLLSFTGTELRAADYYARA
ncbi:NUDIX hydrolase [Pseudonocardia sp. TRM90224]|uniref:NUDIX hydrolase n=1 Tax=Pseudonocardia sp. TRM90224 TaxID=2812678 RepID=UPI001E315743|nr:NUDIX hydrolase [Pseudonocardia sp. TRM90224]